MKEELDHMGRKDINLNSFWEFLKIKKGISIIIELIILKLKKKFFQSI